MTKPTTATTPTPDLEGYDLILRGCLDISAQTRTLSLHIIDQVLRTYPEAVEPTQAFALAAITSRDSTARYLGYTLVAQMAVSSPPTVTQIIPVLFTQLLAKDDDNRLQSLGLMTAFAGIADSGFALDQTQPNLRPSLDYIAENSNHYELRTLAKAISLRLDPQVNGCSKDMSVGEIAEIIARDPDAVLGIKKGNYAPS
jgi:hypothetical protein